MYRIRLDGTWLARRTAGVGTALPALLGLQLGLHRSQLRLRVLRLDARLGEGLLQGLIAHLKQIVSEETKIHACVCNSTA